MLMEHGWKPYFPPWPPLSPVCYMEACGTRCGFFKLPRSPRRLRQRGGLNARCHSASQNIFCDVAACAAIPSLGPCALGTHGLAPCVRVCTGIFCHCIWRLESPIGRQPTIWQRHHAARERREPIFRGYYHSTWRTATLAPVCAASRAARQVKTLRIPS